MAKDTAPSFQFYPRDFMADPAVQAMPWDMRGRYVWALCCSSLSATPGKAPEDTFRQWMGYKPTRWPHVRALVAAAFQIEPDGTWIQKRLMQEREAQRLRYEESKRGGDERSARMTPDERAESARKAANARWGMMPAEHALTTHPMRTPASASASASEASTVSAIALTPSTGVEVHSANSNGRAPRTPRTPSKDWRESFADHFWPAYPRHVGRAVAQRAWDKLGLTDSAKTDESAFFNRIMDGLDDWKARHKDAEPQFIPHASTWLNQHRWEDTDR